MVGQGDALLPRASRSQVPMHVGSPGSPAYGSTHFRGPSGRIKERSYVE